MLTVLHLLPAPVARADEPRYPRLANMYLHGSADDSAIPQLARWDVLILDPSWSANQLRQMRLLNPSIKIFLYTCPYCVETPPPPNEAWRQTNHAYAVANDLWWRNWNQTIASDWPGTQLVNITAEAPSGPQGTWREYFAARVEQLMRDYSAADGVFYDNFWKTISWEQGGIIQVDSDCNPTHNVAGCDGVMDSDALVDTLWNDALRTLAADTRARFDDLYLHRSGRPLAILSNSSSDYFDYLNGTLHEYFPSGAANPDPGNPYGYNWNQEMLGQPGGYLVAPFRSVPYRASVLNADWAGTWEAPDRSPEYERHKRFTLVSALLGDGYYSLDAAETGHGSLWWEPEYDHAGRGKGYLGFPLGPMQRVGVPSGPEKIANGSFTNGTTGWSSLPYLASGSWQVDGAEYHTSPGAARIDVTGVQPDGYFKLYQSVQIEADHGYTLSFWARASVPQELMLHLYSPTCPKYRCLTDQIVVIGTEWQRHEIAFVAAGSAPLAGVNLFVRQVGSVWLDDLSLREGDSSIYRRDFDHGIVILNYTLSPQTVDLGGTFWHLNVPGWPLYDGAATTSETLAPSDARILLRAQVTDAAVVPPPARVRLTNDPNPFNPMTWVRFELPRAGHVDLAVYDLAGRRVRTLLGASQPAEQAIRVQWDGRDDRGEPVRSGVYICRLLGPGVSATLKMILVH